jgi:hypothetical protein
VSIYLSWSLIGIQDQPRIGFNDIVREVCTSFYPSAARSCSLIFGLANLALVLIHCIPKRFSRSSVHTPTPRELLRVLNLEPEEFASDEKMLSFLAELGSQLDNNDTDIYSE